jgi:hypothetical protein
MVKIGMVNGGARQSFPAAKTIPLPDFAEKTRCGEIR